MRKGQKKKSSNHYCILVNHQATNYSLAAVKKLTSTIRKKGDNYTIFEPESAFALLNTALKSVGVKKWHRTVPKAFTERGKVTALVACGGDGTVNLVARAGINANIPVGILPMGKFNNIANSLYDSVSTDSAIQRILQGTYKLIDVGSIGEQNFIGSIALRFTPEMQKLLTHSSLSRFAFKWGQYAGKAASDLKTTPLIVKIDAFRFEVTPTVLNINLLSKSVGIPISPTSLVDDGRAEIILDFDKNINKINQFIRQLYKEKYMFGNEFKMFRGQRISIQPVKGDILYLDGELLELPNDVLDVEIKEKQLKIFC